MLKCVCVLYMYNNCYCVLYWFVFICWLLHSDHKS